MQAVPARATLHSRRVTIRRLLAPAAAGVAIAILVHQVDLPKAAAELRFADVRWLLLAGALTTLSATAGAITWGLLARAAGLRLSWPQIASWSGRAVLAGQLVPGGAGGDAVRVVAGRSAGGLGPALASDLVARTSGSVGITVWALAAALLLRDDLGWPVVWVAAGLAVGTMLSLLILLEADRLLGVLDGRTSRIARAVSAKLHPLADALGAYRARPGLVLQTVLLSGAGWGLNLTALVCLGHAVGAALGWQVFAVSIPVTLLATLMPLSANGVGVRESILIGLLGRAGVAGAQGAALSVLVDVQLLPVALLGAALGLVIPCRSGADQRTTTAPVAAGVAPAPVVVLTAPAALASPVPVPAG